LSERNLYEQFRDQIEALRERPLNFHFERQESFTAESGWRIDDHQTALPSEPPGPPLPDGPWAKAKQILQDYRFADPSIITGIFQPDTPLDKRVMLLRGRAYGMTFWLGTRIGEVIDKHDANEAGAFQVWGYTYLTLEGHLERGQMEFTVIKWLNSGEVTFRMRAFSQPGDIPNPIIRLGFKLLGRRLQLRFINNSLERMRMLVINETATSEDADISAAAPVVTAQPTAMITNRLHVQAFFNRFVTNRLQGVSLAMQLPETLKNPPIHRTDVRRWLVFTSFWGSLFYVLASTSQIIAARQRPVKLDTPTLGIGYAMHIATFIAGGSAVAATSAIVRGKPTTEQSEEAISGGQLEQNWALQAAGGAVGSLVPFALTVISQRIAGRRTGRPAISSDVNWPLAGGAMIGLSGLVALGVARIVAWVAQDAKSDA
jgi:uncharacterized protein (UPF0548 family)